MDGREQPDIPLLRKGFPEGTRWLREGRDLLRLLTMTNNNKVGYNDFFLTKENSTKQLYLSLRHKGLGNAMNYPKDHVI